MQETKRFEVEYCTEGRGVIDYKGANNMDEVSKLVREYKQYSKHNERIFVRDNTTSISFEVFGVGANGWTQVES